MMQSEYYGDFDTEIAYIIQECFEQLTPEDIDFPFLELLGTKFWEYQPVVQTKVDEFATTFGYEEMDMIDRVIFVLGFAEYVELHTPKEIVLNEMVELAKRYGDESSSKLINGIGHKVLSSVDTPGT
ncbi:MAG: hypothetical protein H6765_05805 [Candidatus Peribacteria bacterium]|nr:MAG: hypothetical protein H6765_05805 [Candidatus Peribacteria bacterium]